MRSPLSFGTLGARGAGFMSCESFGGGQDRRGRSPRAGRRFNPFLGGPTPPSRYKTPPRFRDGVHSVGAAYLCEEHCLFVRRGRRLELKATPPPGRLVIV